MPSQWETSLQSNAVSHWLGANLESTLETMSSFDIRDHFVYAPSQWETMLQCYVVSHWLSTYTKWSLNTCINTWGLEQNGQHFADNFFKCIFLTENLGFDWNSTRVCSWGPIDKRSALVKVMGYISYHQELIRPRNSHVTVAQVPTCSKFAAAKLANYSKIVFVLYQIWCKIYFCN